MFMTSRLARVWAYGSVIGREMPDTGHYNPKCGPEGSGVESIPSSILSLGPKPKALQATP